MHVYYHGMFRATHPLFQISFNGTQFAIFQALVPVTTADTFRFNANDCAYLHVVDTWSPC